MRTLFRLLPILLLSSCATPSRQQVSYSGILPAISAPQTLQFMGESYDAGYSACDATKAIVEYYRPGESPKHWTRMLALRLNIAGPNSFQQVETMGESIRAGGNGAVATYKHDDGYGIDFILTTRRHPALDTFHYVVPFPLPTSAPYQEFDAFRYVDRTNGAGSVSIQFAQIIPHEDLVRMMETSRLVTYYQGLRVEAVGALWSVSMPTIEKVPPPMRANKSSAG